jgi:hypothetical protein
LPGWSRASNRFYNSRDTHKLRLQYKCFRLGFDDFFEFKIFHEYPDTNVFETTTVTNFKKQDENWSYFSIDYHHPVQQLAFIVHSFMSFRLTKTNSIFNDKFDFEDFCAHVAKEKQSTTTSEIVDAVDRSEFIKLVFGE